MKLYFLLPILAFALTSCIKTIDFDDKTLANRLVLNSQIMPSDFFSGTVRKSTSILSDASNPNVENGSVKLFENSKLLSEFTFEKGYFMKPELNFKEGKTYRVEISADNQTISAETSIPEPAPVLKMDSISLKPNGGERIMQIYITFRDNIETKDYYQVVAYEEQTYQITDQNGDKREYTTAIDLQIIRDDAVFSSVYTNFSNDVVDLNPENSYNIFPDDYFEGKEYKLKFGTKSYGTYSYGGGVGYGYNAIPGSGYQYGYPELISGKTTVYFRKISKDLYNYLKYLKLYDTYKDNPIAEPVPVYSNIKNGAGIFAGYTINSRLKWETVYKKSK
jgi:hypothetical protein